MKKKALSLLLSLLLVLSMLAPLGVVSFACWPHVYDNGEITTEPTCGTPGVLTYICTVCGYVYNEPIPASGRTSLTAAILQPSRPTTLRRTPVSTTRRTPKHR